MTEPNESGAPDGAQTGGEQPSDRDAAIAAVDELVAASEGGGEDQDEPEGEPGNEDGDADGEPEGDEDKPGDGDPEDDSEDDSGDDSEDGDGKDDEPPAKLSGRVREAHRRERRAERKLAEAQEVAERNRVEREALDARDKEWRTFEVELKRNPLQAIATRMGITVPRLIAAYGEDGKGEVPEAVSLELEELRKEVQGLRDERKERDAERKKQEKTAKYQAALDADAKLISDMVDDDEVADRYQYFAALTPAQRARKARALQDYIVKNLPNPGQYTEDDLLEALDAKEKDRIEKLEKSGAIKWLGRKKKGASDDGGGSNGDGKPSEKSRRPRTPSARKAASGAPAPKDMTDEQLRKLAAKTVDELRAGAE